MAIPKYDELYGPFLRAIKDGKVHDWKEIRSKIIKDLGLSEENLAELLPRGRQTIFHNRLGWSKTYLLKGGFVSSPKRSNFKITDTGKRLIESGQTITNDLLSKISPEFAAFIGKPTLPNKQPDSPALASDNVTSQDHDAETPQEALERAYGQIKEQLAEDLLMEIMDKTPAFFEGLVVDLMRAMGYGDGFVTKTSGDAGIDGIIYEDKLGFNLILIQAKRWKPNDIIHRPEIQKFAGAMMGPPRVDNGLFISTSLFSEGAKKYAEDQHIILIDGKKLCELMIEFGVGVSTIKSYSIKRVDGDYFSDN